MYAVGDFVIYGSNGVCQVAEVGQLDGRDAGREYYTLKPKYSSETIYAPVDTGVYMRRVISREEAEALIDNIPELEPQICSERNSRVLSDHYKQAIGSHSCQDLIHTIKEVHVKTARAVAQKRKPGQVDQYFGKLAEDLLHGELAVALDIPLEEVKPYIAGRIKARKTEE